MYKLANRHRKNLVLPYVMQSKCCKQKGRDNMKNNIPRQGEIYKHYKGNLYQITAVAMHTETEEMMVVYQALYGDFKYYTRPLKMFMEQVDLKGKKINRFTLINFYNSSKDEINNIDNVAIYNEADSYNEESTYSNKEYMGSLSDAFDNDSEREYSLMGFLDAKNYTDKMNILKEMRSNGSLNEQILRNCAMSIDCVVDEDGIDEQYYAIMNCLKMLSKFECTRLR